MGARSEALRPYGDDFAWSLLDAAPDATLLVDSSGRIEFVNNLAGTLFGFRLEDLVGRVIEDLLPEALRSVHRAHRTRYRAEPTVRSMGVGLTLKARRADGTEFPVEISLSPLRLGNDVFAMAAVRDISDRVAAEDQLRRVIQTLDASSDGVFIFDAETLRFSFVNEGAVRLMGYSREELVHMTPLHLDSHAADDDYRQLVSALKVGDDASSVARQARLMRKDGTEVPVEQTYRMAPTGHDGTRWVIGLARDVRARLAAEAELRRSQDALREAEQVLAVADDRERIARDLHDTVIQRLFGLGLSIQSALSRVDDPARTRARLETAVEGLDQTIRELRQAVFSLQGGTVDPGGLRGRLLKVITESTEALGFEPRLQFEGPIETIDGRIAEHMVAVLREALSNVARHAAARSARVVVAVDDRVTLSVLDDGKGVPGHVLGGRGLSNLGERARSLGGEFDIHARPEGGSVLVWSVPSELGERQLDVMSSALGTDGFNG